MLRSLQVTATGQYECVARNSQGVVSTGALLIVKKGKYRSMHKSHSSFNCMLFKHEF